MIHSICLMGEKEIQKISFLLLQDSKSSGGSKYSNRLLQKCAKCAWGIKEGASCNLRLELDSESASN